MTSETREITATIRGVKVELIEVIVEGHTVEQVLRYEVEEAEKAHSRPFDDELDRHMQMGMFAIDRISADGTIGKVAAAVSYVLDGKCIRTAKIEHCSEVAPISSGWQITNPDGSNVPQQPWSCVKGAPPNSHRLVSTGDRTKGE